MAPLFCCFTTMTQSLNPSFPPLLRWYGGGDELHMQVKQRYPKALLLPATWVFMTKFLAGAGVAVLALARLGINLFIGGSATYELLYDGIIFSSWVRIWNNNN